MTSAELRIPFMRYDRQFTQNREAFLEAMLPLLERGEVLQGPTVTAFENMLTHVTGLAHAISCSSGTDALMLSLTALSLREGARIAVPALTFVASAAPILHMRCVPVFVDCDPETGLADENALLDLIERRMVDAVIVVHLYGQLFNLERVAAAAAQAGIPVIEDAAQALGATRHGKAFGQFGCVSALSFSPMKVIGAFGNGGAVLTNDADLARRVRLLRYHGHDGKGRFLLPGFNALLPAIQAAALSVKLAHLDVRQARHEAIAQIFDGALSDARGARRIRTLPGNGHNWHKYVLWVDQRDAVRTSLGAAGIECKVHYELSLHRQPLFAKHVDGVQCPNTDSAAKHLLSLPIYPELTDDEAKYIENVTRATLDALS